MPTRSGARLVPVGSKMSDAAYPFRGEHRLEDVINHGHSGISKKAPTSLALSIAGSNLVIEQLQGGKGAELSCELGVDGGLARPVALSTANKVALAVPGDGRTYNLTAILKTDTTKHYCRMTFNGSEGRSYIRMRAPDNAPPDSVYIVVDGKPQRPSAGWFSIPLSASECSLVVSVPSPALSLWPGVGDGRDGARSLIRTPRGAVLPSVQSVADVASAPATFVLETVPGVNEKAVLQCTTTGQLIALTEAEVVAVPVAGGPSRLHLPAVASVPVAPTATPPAAAATTPAVAPQPAPAGTGGAPVASAIPEIETRMNTNPAGGMPSYVVTAKGFQVQLTADNGATVTGLGSATLPLTNRYSQRVRIAISDTAGKIILRQTSFTPSMQAPPITLRLTEDATGMTVFGNERTTLTIGSTKSGGTGGARVNRGMLQRVTADQTHMDGSASSVALDIGARPSTYTPASVAGTPASPGVKPEEQWLATLAQALQAPNMDEARRLMQQVRAPNTNASAVVTFVMDTLFKAPPTITFLAQNDALQAIQCAGYNLTATVQSQPPCLIAANTSVQVPPNGGVTLTAVNSKNGRSMAACAVRLGPQQSQQLVAGGVPGGMAPGGGVTAGSPISNGDTLLVSRVLDTVQRQNMDLQRTAAELSAASTAEYTPSGQRLVPLLVNMLHHALTQAAGGVKEHLHFTCGNGFLTNIYTEHPQYRLTAFIDNQPGVVVQQRGRLPAEGAISGDQQPHFVRLIAQDPVTGAQKADITVTVLGEQLVQPPLQPAPFPQPSALSSPQLTAPVQQAPPPTEQERQYPATATPAPSFASPTSPVAQAPMPYLDVSLQRTGADMQVRLVCAPAYRIVCGVDGAAGGDTGRCDVVARVAGSQPHRVEVSLVDAYGRVAFQQKVEVPALGAAVWGVAVQDGGLSVDPAVSSGAGTTASVDRAVERVVQSNHVPLDITTPHYIVLRRYVDGLQGGPSGELSIRIPGFMNPKELEQLVQLYRTHAAGQINVEKLQAEMCSLRDRATCPPVRDLISLLLNTWMRVDGAAGTATSAQGPRPLDKNYVYFRLTGA